MSTWLITGASRGLGADITRAALEAGHRVAASARDPRAVTDRFPQAGDALLPLALDVTDEEQAHAAVQAVRERFGALDVLVNNAGSGLVGAVEEVADAAARQMYDTNVFGVLNVLRAALPLMRAQKSGHIINMSSVGGFAGAAGWGIYQSTKFAVEGMSEALAAEVAPLGIKVTVVEPGYFRTDFLDGSSLHTEPREIDDYAATSGRARTAAVRGNGRQPGDPVKAGLVIAALGGSENPPTRLQLGTDCVERVESKLQLVHEELAAWRSVSLSTDHDDVTTA